MEQHTRRFSTTTCASEKLRLSLQSHSRHFNHRCSLNSVTYDNNEPTDIAAGALEVDIPGLRLVKCCLEMMLYRSLKQYLHYM